MANMDGQQLPRTSTNTLLASVQYEQLFLRHILLTLIQCTLVPGLFNGDS
jgi:hypothetical protein